MSLIVDKFFFNALRTSDEIKQRTSGRIFNTARPDDEEAADSVPYIIITYEGMTNNATHKDIQWEGWEDTETVSVLVVAETRESLALLITDVRRSIKAHAEDESDDQQPIDYTVSASVVQYDSMKPCFYQTLTYVCVTDNK